MKIKVVGNSCTWFSSANTNFLINDNIIVDTPQSSTKFMQPFIDYEKIKYIFITHFHSDHFSDLHIIYDWLKKRKNKERVIVIGPKTLLKRLVILYKVLEHPQITKKKMLKVFDVIELKGGEELKLDGFTVKAVRVEHSIFKSFGYVFKFEDCKKTVGFSGDCRMCEGLNEIIEKSDVIFLDTASREKNNNHVCVAEALEIKKLNKKKKIYNVHVTDMIKEKFAAKLNIPDCGETIEI